MNGNPWYIYVLLLVPITYLVGAGMLNLSCRICSVEPPGFWRALLVVAACAVASTGLINVLGLHDAAHWGFQILLSVLVSCGLVCFMLKITLGKAIRVVLLEHVMTIGVILGILAAAVVIHIPLNIHQPQATQQQDNVTPFNPPPATFLADPHADR